MATDPLVSVLVPLHNKEAMVAATVESALVQTHRNIEVLVIDDGSTDASAERIREIVDPRLRFMSRENRGANATRNELLEWSRGDFIQFLDADDHLDPRKLERQLSVVRSGEAAVLCRVAEVRNGAETVMPQPPDGSDLGEFLVHHGIVTVGPLHRRSALIDVGGFDESLRAAQEYDLHLRLHAAGHWDSIAVIDEILAHWRRTGASTTGDELVVYLEKARVLQSRARETPDTELRSAMGTALVNAGRHLARQRAFAEAESALRDGLRLGGGREGVPRRLRPFSGSAKALVAAEVLDDAMRRRWSDRRSRREERP